MHKREKKPVSAHQGLIERFLKCEEDAQLLELLKETNNSKPKFAKKDQFDSWAQVFAKLDGVFERCSGHLEKELQDSPLNVPFITESFKMRELLVEALRFVSFLLENLASKYQFTPKHLAILLEVDDLEIVAWTLKVLSSFVQKRLASEPADIFLDAAFEDKLFALSQGWGVSLLNSTLSQRLSVPLHFEFYHEPTKEEPSARPGQKVIHIASIEDAPESPREILRKLAEKLGIPKQYHFPLFSRIRLCKALPDFRLRMQLVSLRLTAYCVMAQTSSHEVNLLTSFFRADPDFLVELMQTVCTLERIPQEVRSMAVKCIVATSADANRLSAVLNATNAGQNHGLLPTTVRRAVATLTSDLKDEAFSLEFLDDLFSMLQCLISTPAGTAALKSSGIVPTILPLIPLDSQQPAFFGVLSKCVATLETLMDADESAMELFKDLDGLQLLIQRLQRELDKIEEGDKGDPVPTTARVQLVKAILRGIAPCLQGRLAPILDGPLPRCLSFIFSRHEKLGGSIYSLAVSTMSGIIHNEPTCFVALDATGLPDSFLNSLGAELFRSSKALTSVPSALGALCLNASGLKKVTEKNAAGDIFGIFTSPDHADCLQGCAATLGSGLDELLRHHPALKPQGVQGAIRIMEALCKLGAAPLERGGKEEELLVDYIANVAKFFETLFLNGDHGRDFIEAKGLDMMIQLYSLPALPPAFSQSYAARSLELAFHALASSNIVSIVRSIVAAINSQFAKMDSLLPWREGQGLLKEMKANPSLQTVVDSIESLILVLGGLVREAPNLSGSVLMAALTEWTTEPGKLAFDQLAMLQRVLLWELAHVKEPSPAPAQEPGATGMETTTTEAAPAANAESAAQETGEPGSSSDRVSPQQVGLLASIHSLSKGLAKTLSYHSRKRDEKVLSAIVQFLAKVLSDHLSWEPRGFGVTERCAYLASAIGELQSLLFDERRNTTHTLLLYYFNHTKGLDQFFKSLEWVNQAYLEQKRQEATTMDTTTGKAAAEAPQEESGADRDEEGQVKTKNPIELALRSAGKVLKLLMNSAMILNSPLTANMLTQTLPGQKGPFDPHAFIRLIHELVLKAVVPMWNDTEAMALYPPAFVSTLVAVMNRNFEGDAPKAEQKPIPTFKPDPQVVDQLTSMGFSKSHAEEALRQIGSNHLEMATEWLINNPEAEAPAEMADDGVDDELALALAMSLGQDKAAEPKPPAASAEPAPSAKGDLLEKCLDLLPRVSSPQSIGDLLLAYCAKGSENYERVIDGICGRMKAGANQRPVPASLFDLARVLAVVLSDSTAARSTAIKCGAVPILLHVLMSATEGELNERVADALLVLDAIAQFQTPTKKEEADLPPALLSDSQQKELLEVCLRLLKSGVQSEGLRATLLLCSRLTRSHELSAVFVQEKGLEALLGLKQGNSSPHTSPLLGAILRHTLEDPATLQTAMEREITSLVASPNPSAKITTKSLLTALAPVVCRDPKVFLLAASAVCRFSPGSTNIVLSKAAASADKLKSPKRIHSLAKQVVGTLVTSLVERVRDSKAPDRQESGQFLTPFKLLQLLSDLAAAYPPVAQIILRHPSGKGSDEGNIIGFILEHVLPFPHNGEASEERQSLNAAGIKVLASLCTRPEGRRRVITEIIGLLRSQTSAMGPDGEGYSATVHTLVDFLFLLLTSRASGAVASEMAKIMLELDVVGALMESIKRTDLNHPLAAEFVNAVVKPLEFLSKAAPAPEAPASQAPPSSAATGSTSQEAEQGIEEEIVLDANALAPADFNDMDENDEEGEEEDRIEEGEMDEEGDEEGDEEDEEGDRDEDQDDQYQQDMPAFDLPSQPLNQGLQIAEEPEINIGAGMRILADLFPLPGGGPGNRVFPFDLQRLAPASILQGEGEPSESPFVFLMDRLSDVSHGVRQVEDQVRRLFGRLNRAPVTSNQWTDDGGKPTPAMASFALRLEPQLTETLTKLTAEDAEREKQEKAAEAKEPQQQEPKQEARPADAAQPADTTQPADAAQPMATESTAQGAQETAPQGPESPAQRDTAESMQTDSTASGQGAAEGAPATAGPKPPSQEGSIDPTFLEALPEELRSELLASQLGQAAAPSGVSTSSLNPDFLAALPPDIQAEVLEQERAERQRIERESAAQAADVSLAQDMDNASFIATLPQELREEILLSQDENFISSLTPQLAAEANALRERASRGRFSWRRELPAHIPAQVRARAQPVHDNKGRPLLPPEALPALVRLLFMQQSLNKNLVHRLFLNLCAYELTRAALVDVITSVLRGERSSVPPAEHTAEVLDALAGEVSRVSPAPFSIFGCPPGQSYSVTAPRHDYLPPLVSRRILEILSYVVKHNPLVPELILGDKGRKSAVEEVQMRPPPIVSLIDLLGIPQVTEHPSHLESVLGVVALSARCKAKKVSEEKQGEGKGAEPSPAARLTQAQIENLARVLTLPQGTSEAVNKHLQAVFEYVAADPANKELLLAKLLDACAATAKTVAAKLDELRAQLEKSALHPTVILATMSPSASVELNFLRLVKAMVSMAGAEWLGEKLKLESLWEGFQACLSGLAKRNVGDSGLVSALSPLLPVIEAFFAANASALGATEQQPSQASPMAAFVQFCERYRKLLNDMVKQNPSLLEESFAVLLKTPHLIDFENKRSYFRSQLQKDRPERDYYGEVRINVRRSQVMEDSFYQLRTRKPEELRGRLSVHFMGEEGIDAGGVSREWYLILAREMFNPNYCLFAPTAEQTFQPNKNSSINHDHLAYFKFIGMVIGKALIDGQLLDAHFTRSFYKHILGLPVSVADMEAIDPDYYKNLKWILDNDVTELDLTFSIQQENFGVMKAEDLKPGGRNIPVTNENKEEYVKLVTEMKMTTAIKPQINSFLEGFSELIKPSLVSIFTPSELELLISGLPDIDIEDLRKNTEYRGYSADSPTIQWFWQIVAEFGEEEKALLLQFVTGTSKVPLDGFKALIGMSGPQKFQIYKVHDKTRLPTAHTCFNQLDLPEYASLDELKKNLMLAIREGSEGFGFG